MTIDNIVRPLAWRWRFGPLSGRLILTLWPWAFLISLVIFFETWARLAFATSFIFNAYNVQSIAVFAAAPLLLGLGQTFVIIAGGIDLSVGFVMGLAAVAMAQTMRHLATGTPAGAAFGVGVLAALCIALVPGTVNGVLIAKLRVPPFIGTLGMYGMARGAGYILADGATVSIDNDWLGFVGNGKILGVPMPVVITVAIAATMHYVLSQTRFGRYIYAVGSNKDAALRAGVNVQRHTIAIYVISALCAAAGGIIFTARFSAGAAQAGEPLLLDSIAAVVIGGASLFGGSGTIIGSIIGALIIAVIQFGLVFVDVKPFWQFAAVGAVIVVSVIVDQSGRGARSGK